jgi:hypothetical protein
VVSDEDCLLDDLIRALSGRPITESLNESFEEAFAVGVVDQCALVRRFTSWKFEVDFDDIAARLNFELTNAAPENNQNLSLRKVELR